MAVRSVLLFVKNVNNSCKFYHETLDFSIVSKTNFSAELKPIGNSHPEFKFGLQQVKEENLLQNAGNISIGIEVENFDEKIPKLIMGGGELVGPIKFTHLGRIALVKTPDNHVLSITETYKY